MSWHGGWNRHLLENHPCLEHADTPAAALALKRHKEPAWEPRCIECAIAWQTMGGTVAWKESLPVSG